jgi:branched-chain amino acid transport system permease protein
MSATIAPPRQASIYPALAVLAVGAVLPYLLHGGFQLRLATLVWIYAILCMGFNLLYGYAGQISLGQQTFFAIGAYAFALLQIKTHWPAPTAFVASLLICAAVALALGVPLLRLRSHYLAMATLAFALIFFGVTTRWIDVTGGATGLAAPQLKWAGAPLGRTAIYYLVLIFAAFALLLHDFVARGAVGRALQAIRDDETGAAALGVDVTRYKLRIFMLAAVFAGMAGIAFSILSLRVDPSMSEFHVLVTILTVAVVGGLGSRFGAILGAAVIIILPQTLVQFGDLETLIYGVFIVVFLVFLPQGLAGLFDRETWRGPVVFAKTWRRQT